MSFNWCHFDFRNTKEYDDFWVFVEKYKAFQRKKAVKKIGE